MHFDIFTADRESETPLVMVHGMGAGLGFFSLNFDKLAKDRTVYAIDLPGELFIAVLYTRRKDVGKTGKTIHNFKNKILRKTQTKPLKVGKLLE